MHDYTIRRIHDDRMREFEREADRSALAAVATQGRPQPGPLVAAWRRLLALAVRPSRGRSGAADSDGFGVAGPQGTAELHQDV